MHQSHEPAHRAEYTYLADRQILLVRTRGALPTSMWPNIIADSVREGSVHSCTRYLFDHRAARFRMRFADLWALPRNMGQSQLPGGARIALLLRRVPALQREFIVAFNSNRGFDLQVFDAEERAVSWLLEPPSRKNALRFPGEPRTE